MSSPQSSQISQISLQALTTTAIDEPQYVDSNMALEGSEFTTQEVPVNIEATVQQGDVNMDIRDQQEFVPASTDVASLAAQAFRAVLQTSYDAVLQIHRNLALNPPETATDNSDSGFYFQQIADFYHTQEANISNLRNTYVQEMRTLLQSQSYGINVDNTEIEVATRAVCNMIKELHSAFRDTVQQRGKSIAEEKVRKQLLLPKARKGPRKITQEAKSILNRWFQDNIFNPYPSREEKEALARQCNIGTDQVSAWFCNTRLRVKRRFQS